MVWYRYLKLISQPTKTSMLTCIDGYEKGYHIPQIFTPLCHYHLSQQLYAEPFSLKAAQTN
jgi:hypothetical protein